MEGKIINAELRTESGKNVNRRLRNAGYIPGILYSHGETEVIKVLKKDFFNLFHGHISESVIFDLNITDKKDDAKQMAFVKDYQIDPVTGDLLHIDFFKVTLGETIHTKVPIVFVGTPIGLKMGGILEYSEREIEIECLPKNLPSEIKVDVTNLDIDDSIHMNELEFGEDITILSNLDSIVVAVHIPKVAKVEEEVEEEEEVEGEVTEEEEANKTETSE